ncbi:MAG: hypothetical protein JRE43_02155 [Deltaproteobacteria bacterium]|jgi:hypothetical protein|nr:hypothetical protein [Deltaproteobacteria bacterium]MBW2541104.1 hypothetical protein [Deltaproteobacteria bacterium]
MRVLTYLAMALLASATTAHAGGGCASGYDPVDVVHHIFNAADQDQDGTLTQLEYEDAGLQVYGVTFEQSDLDADGVTSIEEYILLYEYHHPVDGETEV